MNFYQLLTSLGLTGAATILATQPALAQVAQVTGVQLNPIPEGLDILLETTAGATTLVQSFQTEQGLVAEIDNAQLSLPGGGAFRQNNPAPGIAAVTMTPLAQNRIQVVVTGTTGVPTGQVFVRGTQGLVVKASPASAFPDQPADPEAITRELEPIELVVTATRTEEAAVNVPRSLTVINREQIEAQTNVSRTVGDILGQSVPGFAPPTQSLSSFGQSLRGRNVSVLIDGVPQSTSRNVFRDLQTIDPSAIERIEVVRGPSAIYGEGATGGVVNIITRRPQDQTFTATTQAGLNLGLTQPSDSLGGNIQQFLSGRTGDFDYTLSASYERIGAFFDAEGDRIPPDPNGQGGISEANIFNILGKFGADLDDNQRLQLTFNRFDLSQDTDFTTNPDILDEPGRQKAQAQEGLVLDTPQGSKNTVLSLDYTHDDVWGSQVKGQLYYRDYFTRFFPFDARSFASLGNVIFQSELESAKLGGRFQVETPLFDEAVSLLTGIDYVVERASQPVNVFDSDTFDASNGLVYRQTGRRTWVPRFDQRTLGIFAQADWTITDQLRLSGGIRHERIGVSVDDYTTIRRDAIAGGELDYDATLFNVGATYSPTDRISLFASFAQGFSLADIGLALRNAPAGFSLESLRPEPQRVDSYEVGIRGNWETVQASIAGFYNTSDLGTTFIAPGTVLRAPERVYGIEATVDTQLSKTWSLGGTLSWTEGEIDVTDEGDYDPLDGFRIPPLKLTAYVENETLPGWRNRLQALYSGSRSPFGESEAFGRRPVDSYFTLDYISSLQVGPGTLEIGVANLLNTQYFPVVSQLQSNELYNTAGRGISLQVGYSFTW